MKWECIPYLQKIPSSRSILHYSCSVSQNVNTTSIPTNNYLHKHYVFVLNGMLEINETCLTTEGIKSKVWTFNNLANLKIPITCQISLSFIYCGGTKFISGESFEVPVQPARMQSLEKSHCFEPALCHMPHLRQFAEVKAW